MPALIRIVASLLQPLTCVVHVWDPRPTNGHTQQGDETEGGASGAHLPVVSEASTDFLARSLEAVISLRVDLDGGPDRLTTSHTPYYSPLGPGTSGGLHKSTTGPELPCS
jgi:hypothetical protein